MRVKRVSFLGLVYNSLLSGLEPYILSVAQEARLDRVIAKLLRALLVGRACDMEGDHPRSWSNERVRRYWKIASVGTELRVRRRAGWAQSPNR